MGVLQKKLERNKRKIKRVRKKISGTSVVPRIAVTQTNKNVYVQVIDDTKGRTLASISSFEKGLNIKGIDKKNIKTVGLLAEKLAEKIQTAKAKQYVLDRRTKKYHGIVKVFAEKLREKGIKI